MSFLSPGILTISGASSFMGFLKVKNVFHDLLVINPVDINKVNKQKIPAYFYWFILVILSIVNGNLWEAINSVSHLSLIDTSWLRDSTRETSRLSRVLVLRGLRVHGLQPVHPARVVKVGGQPHPGGGVGRRLKCLTSVLRSLMDHSQERSIL